MWVSASQEIGLRKVLDRGLQSMEVDIKPGYSSLYII